MPMPSKESSSLSDIEKKVLTSWPTSTREDAEHLVETIISNPSVAWRQLMLDAEQHKVVHWDILLENSDRIYESIAERSAMLDGEVRVPDDL